MDGHENLAKRQSTDLDWDALRPENNGLGEFSNWVTEVSSDAPAEDKEVREEEPSPIMVDSHSVNKTLVPGDTAIATCNILDEWWCPDLDDSRPDEMTIEQRFDELRQRQQFLDSLEDYLRKPNSKDEWKFTGIDQTVADSRDSYLAQLERERQNPDDQQIHAAVKDAHDHLVEVRTYQYLASDPKARRKEIAYERTGLGQVLAIRDERYKSAFSEVDVEQIEERVNQILDRIPQREYDSLTRLIGEDGMINNKFTAKTLKVVSKALGLKRGQLEFDTFDDVDSTSYGNCRDLGKGCSLVKMNKAKTQEALEYANTLAHEVMHAKQHQIQYTHRNKPIGKFYEYCFDYYVASAFNYDKYATQYTEKEASYFGDEFSRRLNEAKTDLPEVASSNSLLDKIRNLIGRR